MSHKIDAITQPAQLSVPPTGQKVADNALITGECNTCCHPHRQEKCNCPCHEEKVIYIPIPKTWGTITGDIQNQKDLIELLQTISSTSAEKEVISVLTYSSSSPADPEEGDKYANYSSNTIFTYTSGEWIESTPSPEAVYIAADTMHMYIYDADQDILVDVTGQSVDNTIYVNDLKDGLKPYLDDGIYKVCYTQQGTRSVQTEWYSMTVLHNSNGQATEYTQILQNKDGYAIRYAWKYSTDGDIYWGAWHWYRYAFEGRNAKKAQLELSFHNDIFIFGNPNSCGGEIYVRDKNNVIEDDDYLVLYYWNRKKRRITAFAGGTGIQQIYPIRWGNIAKTSMRKQKGWKDDWRKLPYTISDIMKRITNLTEGQMSSLTWEGGMLKGTLLGSMYFVGGKRGNSFSTKLWIGVAKDLSYSGGGVNDTHVSHFRIGELMHRIPFYIRCVHKPAYSNQTFVEGHVFYQGSLSRKPHLYFGHELSPWQEQKQ